MIVRWLFITLCCLASACAGGLGGAPGEFDVPPPPVTGDVKLSFMQMIGMTSMLRSPGALSCSMDGTLYVCDPGSGSIVRIDPFRGELSRYDGGISRNNRRFLPVDVSATDGTTVYAIDAASGLIRFDRNLRNSYPVFDTELDGDGLFGMFNGLAYDHSTGDVFLTDSDLGGLVRYDAFSGNLWNMGAFGSGERSLNQPAGMDISLAGVVYIADPIAGVVVQMSRNGSDTMFLGEGLFEAPVDVAVIENLGIAVADRAGIVILSEAGEALGIAGFGTDRLMQPRGVAFGNGSLYVSDGLSGAVLVYGIER